MMKRPMGFRNKALHLLYRIQGKRVLHFLHFLHFLHLGKTGGTAVKHALIQAPSERRHVLYLHSHNVKLQDIAKGEGVFFCVRNPTSRFISGLYSRQRQGEPRHFTPWSPEEKIAFEFFYNAKPIGKRSFLKGSGGKAHGAKCYEQYSTRQQLILELVYQRRLPEITPGRYLFLSGFKNSWP